MQKLFVTGATGFIGSHFVREALKSGYSVTGLKRSAQSNCAIDLKNEPEWIIGDLACCEDFHLSGYHTVVHLAAYGVSPQPCKWEKAMTNNVVQPLELFMRASDCGVTNFLAVGTCHEYGTTANAYLEIPPNAPLKPLSAYGASKAAFSIAASALCRERHFRLQIARLFAVYGEGQNEANFWPSLRRAALSGNNFMMSPGEQVSDFSNVSHIVSALLNSVRMLGELTPGTPVSANIGSGETRSLKEFACDWWSSWNATGKLDVGAIPYRGMEIMRYVPLLNKSSDRL